MLVLCRVGWMGMEMGYAYGNGNGEWEGLCLLMVAVVNWIIITLGDYCGVAGGSEGPFSDGSIASLLLIHDHDHGVVR